MATPRAKLTPAFRGIALAVAISLVMWAVLALIAYGIYLAVT